MRFAAIRAKNKTMMRNFHQVVDAVQKNCYITDARHARDMTMCTYLLEMRQYYHWEHELPLSRTPPKDDLGNWLVEREELWNQFEDSSYQPIPVAADLRDPFDSEAINRALLPQGYVYSGGYGRFRKPHFFLGRLLYQEQRQGFTVLVADCEYARDLIAPPAALLDRTIFLRREAVRRFLWEKVEEWRWKGKDNTLGRALACYDFESDADAALDSMTESESEAMILHEVGEGLAGEALEASWNEMLAALSSRRHEIQARAVRDNLADCLSTLPVLLEREAHCSLHFYFANFDGMRKQLFPQLLQAYQIWTESDDVVPLHAAIREGKERWLHLGRQMVAAYECDRKGCDNAIDRLLGAEECSCAR